MQVERIGETKRGARRERRLPGSTLWVTSRDKAERSGLPPEPLLVDGGEALAVFGHEEEAQMFLGFWAPGGGWRAREIGAGEFVSLLRDTYRPGTRRVALDPLPEALAGAVRGNLPVGVDRERFAERLACDLDRGADLV